MPFNTFTVASAVTPSVIETYFSHFLHRAPLKQKPTAHISYHEGLALIRNFLEYASKHTVEDLQAFTQQWVPAPSWVRVQNVDVPQQFLERAAESLVQQLGEQGLRDVGGKTWWRWRGPAISPLKAEWIEMKKDYNERKSGQKTYDKVILYVHGGAYYFGSVDEHRYQMQRHARKLKARVLAPRYRLAPQYPFPCGLQDCLATYLFLLEQLPPNQILLAGDSAGGGMVLAMLVTMRDQGIPLPAGSILLSPWSDLTHSFPSVAGKGEGDYIPSDGLSLYKPSLSWPPPPSQPGNAAKTAVDAPAESKTRKRSRSIKSSKSMRKESVKNLVEATAGANGAQAPAATKGEQPEAGMASTGRNGLATSTGDQARPQSPQAGNATPRPGFGLNLSVELDGKMVEILDQIQLYTTNQALCNPLVSPVLQPSLGGLPPMLIQVGSAELLSDEQIYLAHKAANPKAYPPSDSILDRYDPERKVLQRYGPTDVQLQVWDDLCHVPHTLSFTRPAKYMYRGVAQFGFWALARAQRQELSSRTDGEDNVSVISSGDDEAKDDPNASRSSLQTPSKQKANGYPSAGDLANNDLSAARPKTNSSSLPEQTKTVGKAGDPLPDFHNNMIRQRVTRHGVISPLEPESEIRALRLKNTEIGILKPVPVRKYLDAKKALDGRFAKDMKKVEKLRAKDMAKGYEVFAGEQPPATALAARRRRGMDDNKKKIGKSWGLAMWSGWGSKHDENTIEREEEAQKDKERPTPSSAGIARTSTRASSSPQQGTEASEPRKSRRSSMLGGGLSLGKDRDRPRTSNSRSPWRKEGDLRPETSREHLTSASQSNLITSTPPDTTTSNIRPVSMAAPPTMSAAQPDSKKVEGTDSTFLSPTSSRPHNGTVAYPFKLRNAVWNPSTATLDSQAPDGTFAAAAVSGSTEHPTSISKSERSTPITATPRSDKARSFVDAGVTGQAVPNRNVETDTTTESTAQQEQTQSSEAGSLPARLDSLPSNDKHLDDEAGPPRRTQTVEDEAGGQAAAEGDSVSDVPRQTSGEVTEPSLASDGAKSADAPNRARTFGDEASAQAAADGGSVVTVPRRFPDTRPESATTGSETRASTSNSTAQSPPVSRGSKEPATSSERSSASPTLDSEPAQAEAKAISPPVSPISPVSPAHAASPRAMNRVSALMTGSPSSIQSQKSHAPAEVDKAQPPLPSTRPLTSDSDDIPPTPPPKDDVSMSTAQAVRLSRANIAVQQQQPPPTERKRSVASGSESSFDTLQHQQTQPSPPQKERYSPIPAPTSRFSTILPNALDFSGNGSGQMGESKHESRSRPPLESFVTASEGVGSVDARMD